MCDDGAIPTDVADKIISQMDDLHQKIGSIRQNLERTHSAEPLISELDSVTVLIGDQYRLALKPFGIDRHDKNTP
jgi:hypothetical protein